MISKEQIDLAWVMQNRSTVANTINSIEALKNASVQIVGTSSRAGVTLSGKNATIVIPIKLPPIDKSTDATNAAIVLNKLIDSLRAAGLM